jgi:hypothetical protein
MLRRLRILVVSRYQPRHAVVLDPGPQTISFIPGGCFGDSRLSGVMLASIALWRAQTCPASITLSHRPPHLAPLSH